MAGNKMSFAGITKPEDRAAVIAYLNSKSASPLPLPAAPAEEAPAAEAAPAEEVAEATAPAAE
jgi:cytochrome c